MIRFFSLHHTATEGTHLHLALISYRRTLALATSELSQRLTPHNHVPLFFDFGPGDSDLRRLDRSGVDLTSIYAACGRELPAKPAFA